MEAAIWTAYWPPEVLEIRNIEKPAIDKRFSPEQAVDAHR